MTGTGLGAYFYGVNNASRSGDYPNFSTTSIIVESSSELANTEELGTSTTTGFDIKQYAATEDVTDGELYFRVRLYTYVSRDNFETNEKMLDDWLQDLANENTPIPDITDNYQKSAWSHSGNILESTYGTDISLPPGYSEYTIEESDDAFTIWATYTTDSSEPILISNNQLLAKNAAGYVLTPQWATGFAGTVLDGSPLSVRQKFIMQSPSEYVLLHIPWTDGFKIVKFDMP